MWFPLLICSKAAGHAGLFPFWRTLSNIIVDSLVALCGPEVPSALRRAGNWLQGHSRAGSRVAAPGHVPLILFPLDWGLGVVGSNVPLVSQGFLPVSLVYGSFRVRQICHILFPQTAWWGSFDAQIPEEGKEEGLSYSKMLVFLHASLIYVYVWFSCLNFCSTHTVQTLHTDISSPHERLTICGSTTFALISLRNSENNHLLILSGILS